MKLTDRFFAVPAGEIYPVWHEIGQECPPELEESARAQGCLAAPAKATKKKA